MLENTAAVRHTQEQGQCGIERRAPGISVAMRIMALRRQWEALEGDLWHGAMVRFTPAESMLDTVSHK